MQIRRRGKFLTESPSLPKESALDFLVRKLKSSTASTGRLVMTSEYPLENIRASGDFAKYQASLRNYQIRKGIKIPTPFQWIEKRGTRLSTRMEVASLKASRGRTKWF